MREEFLYFLWQTQRFKTSVLRTVSQKEFKVVSPGTRNPLAGPDFLHARLQFREQLWIGHVEIHVKASDWYAHHHETDPAYDNVVLHAVWDADVHIFGKDQHPIPTFSIREHLSRHLLSRYHTLYLSRNTSFLFCGQALNRVPRALVDKWIEKLYLEKQESAMAAIKTWAIRVNHHWEHLLFLLLFKRFGGNINGAVFTDAAVHIPFKVVQKISANRLHLESVFFGMTRLLELPGVEDPYFYQLRKEFSFLCRKFKLRKPVGGPPGFFKLRPPNFPTIRLAQLAGLYFRRKQLFSQAVLFRETAAVYTFFRTGVSPYWESHYVFGKPSEKRDKKITQSFVDLLLANELIPLRNYYLRSTAFKAGGVDLGIARGLKPEKNSVTRQFEQGGLKNCNGLTSQGLHHLYKNYCLKTRCLHCAIGQYVLKGK